MIIDSHAHFEPRMLSVDRVLSKMREAGVDRIALIPTMSDPLEATPKRLMAAARILMQSRIGRPIAERVHRMTLTRSGDLRLGGRVYGIYPQPDNASVARVVEAHPAHFLGWIFLNPRTGKALDELERWRGSGMFGVKLHPHWHDYTTDLLDPILRRAEELKMPALIHLGFGRRGDYLAIAARFPKLVVIAAHAGFPFYQDLWAHAKDCPNLHVDLSSPYLDEKLARAAALAMGPERCLYGTDAPYGFHEDDGSYDYREIRGWVERMPLSTAQRERVLHENFARILADAGAA
jgi:predicted TIM-barrel fold metal-dependent hydrolase